MANSSKTARRITLKEVNGASEKKTISITFGEAVLDLTYNRSKYTPKFERETKELMNDNLPANMLAYMVFQLIIDWNLEDVVDDSLPEDKQEWVKVPLTLDTFVNLFSAEALAKIVEALAGDNRPNETPSGFTSNI